MENPNANQQAGSREVHNMSTADQFIGTWELVSTRFHAEDGTRVDSPYGSDPQGILMYDANGFMAAQLCQGRRRPFPTADRKAGDDEQTRAAFESYQAYCGRYRIDLEESMIIHTVIQSLLPNWVGTEQRRHFTFTDGQLVLRTPPMSIGGRLVSGELQWKRRD